MKPRSIQVVIPFKLENAKSRLSSVLSPKERRLLALTMLKDVAEVVSCLGDVVVLSREALPELHISLSTKVIVCDDELDPALNGFIAYWERSGWPSDILIAMADLPLMREQEIEELVATPGEVVVAPGRGGGTNLILVRDPRFRVHYYGLSYLKHRHVAQDLGLSAGVYESYRCGCDIDEPSDLVEVIVHGLGRTPEFLRKLGFSLNGEREKLRAECLRETR